MIAFPISHVRFLQEPFTQGRQALDPDLQAHFEIIESNVDCLEEAKIICIEGDKTIPMGRLIDGLSEPHSICLVEEEEREIPLQKELLIQPWNLPFALSKEKLIRCSFLEDHPSFYARVKFREKAKEISDAQILEQKDPCCDVCTFCWAEIGWAFLSCACSNQIKKRQSLKKRHYQQVEIDRIPEKLTHLKELIIKSLEQSNKVFAIANKGSLFPLADPLFDRTRAEEGAKTFLKYLRLQGVPFALLKERP